MWNLKYDPNESIYDEINTENGQVVVAKGEGGTQREAGDSDVSFVCRMDDDKVLRESTGNFQYPMINHNGKAYFKVNACVCVYVCVCIHIELNSSGVQQNLTQHCNSTILQLKTIVKIVFKERSSSF